MVLDKLDSEGLGGDVFGWRRRCHVGLFFFFFLSLLYFTYSDSGQAFCSFLLLLPCIVEKEYDNACPFPRIRYGTLAHNSKSLGARTWSRERAICRTGRCVGTGDGATCPERTWLKRHDPSASVVYSNVSFLICFFDLMGMESESGC